MFSQVITGMGDRLQAGIPPRYVTKPTSQPSSPLRSLNWVPALIGKGERGIVTSARWCDPIRHVDSHSGEAMQTAMLHSSYSIFQGYEDQWCQKLPFPSD